MCGLVSGSMSIRGTRFSSISMVPPFRVWIEADLSARADGFDGEAGACDLGPPDARTIAVHHELEVEQPPSGVEPADRVAAANNAALVTDDPQGQVLARQIFEGLEKLRDLVPAFGY